MATDRGHPQIARTLDLAHLLEGKSHFVLGPRQTGKTTLIRSELPEAVFGWLRVARRRMARESGKNEPAFAPVIVEASRSSSIEPRPGGWALIEMVIGAVTVRIPPGIDAVTLMTVLRAVRAAA